MQPFDSARSVFRVDRPAVSQFAVQHDSRLISSLADEYPVARLVDFAKVSVIQVGIAHNQANSRHFPLEHFDCYRKDSAYGR